MSSALACGAVTLLAVFFCAISLAPRSATIWLDAWLLIALVPPVVLTLVRSDVAGLPRPSWFLKLAAVARTSLSWLDSKIVGARVATAA